MPTMPSSLIHSTYCTFVRQSNKIDDYYTPFIRLDPENRKEKKMIKLVTHICK